MGQRQDAAAPGGGGLVAEVLAAGDPTDPVVERIHADAL